METARQSVTEAKVDEYNERSRTLIVDDDATLRGIFPLDYKKFSI